MENQEQKTAAIKAYNEEMRDKAKEAFQKDVNELLDHISSLSRQLENAKKRFKELKYEEPTPVEVD